MNQRLLSTLLEILGGVLLTVVIWHFSLWLGLAFIGVVLIVAAWFVDGAKR